MGEERAEGRDEGGGVRGEDYVGAGVGGAPEDCGGGFAGVEGAGRGGGEEGGGGEGAPGEEAGKGRGVS